MNKFLKKRLVLMGGIAVIMVGSLFLPTKQKSNTVIVYAKEIKDVETTKEPQPVQLSEEITLYVNGNKVDTAPYQLEGVTYVPLKPIVEGIGDKYSWDNLYLSAIVTTNSGKTVQLVTGWSVMFIDNKYTPITTKKVDDVTVPVKVKPVLKNGIFYVPLDIISDTLSYPVDTTEITNIYVGEKPESITPTEPEITEPEPVKPETTESTESETTEPTDSIANYESIQILKNEYGFKSYTESSAFFNSQIDYMRMNSDIIVSTVIDSQSVTISITNWQDAVKPYAKNAFNLYLPEKGAELYSMVDAYYNGNGNQYLDKCHTMEGHRVYLYYFENGMTMQIEIYNK